MSNYDELTMLRDLRAEFDDRLDEMHESPYWQDIAAAIYEWASDHLYVWADEAGLN